MPFLGVASIVRFYRPIDNILESILDASVPFRARAIYLIAVSTLPSLLATLLLPDPGVVFVVLLTIPLIWRLLGGEFQQHIFEYDREEITFYVAAPFYAYFLSWGAIAIQLGRPEMLGRAIGGVIFLVLVAIWPIYRSNKHMDRKTRKIPFDNVYLAAGILVAIQQIVVFMEVLI